jgi:hypothetical protein
MERKIEVHIYPEGNLTWQEVGTEILPAGSDCEASVVVNFAAVPKGAGLKGSPPEFDLCVDGSVGSDYVEKILQLLQAGQVSRYWAKTFLALALRGSVGPLPELSGEPVPENTVPVELGVTD